MTKGRMPRGAKLESSDNQPQADGPLVFENDLGESSITVEPPEPLVFDVDLDKIGGPVRTSEPLTDYKTVTLTDLETSLTEVETLPEGREVEFLSRWHAVIRQTEGMTTTLRWHIGKHLKSIRNSKPHGDWLTWFGDNKDALGFSIETARRYIKLHERYDDPEQLRGMTTVDAYQSAQILRPQQTELEKAIEGLDSMTADDLPKLRSRIRGLSHSALFLQEGINFLGEDSHELRRLTDSQRKLINGLTEIIDAATQTVEEMESGGVLAFLSKTPEELEAEWRAEAEMSFATPLTELLKIEVANDNYDPSDIWEGFTEAGHDPYEVAKAFKTAGISPDFPCIQRMFDTMVTCGDGGQGVRLFLGNLFGWDTIRQYKVYKKSRGGWGWKVAG